MISSLFSVIFSLRVRGLSWRMVNLASLVTLSSSGLCRETIGEWKLYVAVYIRSRLQVQEIPKQWWYRGSRSSAKLDRLAAARVLYTQAHACMATRDYDTLWEIPRKVNEMSKGQKGSCVLETQRVLRCPLKNCTIPPGKETVAVE